MTSSSALGDALISTLTTQSASLFSSASQTGNVSMLDWSILDTSSCPSVYMVLPPSFNQDTESFGGEEKTTTMQIKALSRDTGNVREVIGRLWSQEKDLHSAIKADPTLGNIAQHAELVRGSGWDGTTFIGTESGPVYAAQDFYVEIFTCD